MSTKANRRFIGADGFPINYKCDIEDKDSAQFYYVMEMLNRTNQMFEYENLPETIPADMFEFMLQVNGSACITKVNGNLYALCGGFGGAPDPYYRPTLYVVANPALGYSASLAIKNNLPAFSNQDTQGECIVIRNDTTAQGMIPLYARYASEMTENDISIRCAQINARQQTLITGEDDSSIQSANTYLENIVKGKIVAVASRAFLDGIKVANVAPQSSNGIIQLIELQQYLKASWYNDIGLNANFNMKREYMSTEELQQSTDVLLPLIDDMFTRRTEAIKLVNETYNTNIIVTKNSAWNNKQVTVDSAVQLQQADAKQAEKQAEGGATNADDVTEEPIS